MRIERELEMIDIGDVLKYIIETNNVNVKQLAKQSGSSRQSIYRILDTGTGNITNINKILDTLGYELEVVPKRKVTQSETWTKECQRCHKQFTSASRNTQYCPECKRAKRKAQSGSKRPGTYSPNFSVNQYELAIRRKAIERAKHNDDIVAEGYAERQIRSSLAQMEPINTKL